MRFGRIHRLMTDALAALGILSLVTSGGLERPVVIALVVGMVLAMSIPERWQTDEWRSRVGILGSVLLLGGQVARLFLGHDVLHVAVEFAAGLQMLRIATRRGAAHDQQIILLALVHLIAGTVVGGGMAYGLCFVGFLIVAPGALVLSHLRREVEGNYRQGARDRSGLPVDVPRILRSRRVVSRRFLLATCSLSLPIFLFTAMLFVFFPRVGLSLLLLNQGRAERMVGFSDQVDLGKVGKLRADSTIALRVFFPELPQEPAPRIALYLRGAAFDSYDGIAWRRDKTQRDATSVGDRVWVKGVQSRLGSELMTIDLEPIKPPVIFLPTGAHAFDVDSGDKPGIAPPSISQGREGDFEYQRPDERGLRYTVYGGSAGLQAAEPGISTARYLSLPAGLPDRIFHLARSWAGDESSPEAIAKRIETRLKTDYTYDLESPSGAALQPLDHFLFESRRGHCEFYSTSMAVMLRALGIPSRNVTGFMGGTFNRFGRFYVVRQGEAHSWVEAYLPGVGWRLFDPTPSAAVAPASEASGMVALIRDLMEAAGERWDRHVVGYDLGQQMELWSNVRRSLGGEQARGAWLRQHGRQLVLVGLTAAGFALVIVWWRRRVRRRGEAGEAAQGSSVAQQRVVRLYKRLEDALSRHGVRRLPGTPPLAHAQALQAMGYPFALDALAVTEAYLAARFGERELSDAEYQGLERAIERVRAGAHDVAA